MNVGPPIVSLHPLLPGFAVQSGVPPSSILTDQPGGSTASAFTSILTTDFAATWMAPWESTPVHLTTPSAVAVHMAEPALKVALVGPRLPMNVTATVFDRARMLE